MSLNQWLGLPPLAANGAQHVDALIVYVHLLMIALFVGWLGYFAFTLWRFRRERNPKADYQGVQTHASSYIEVAVAGVEAALLVFVAFPIWAVHSRDFPKPEDSTQIQVVAQQFAWNARYPGRDVAFGRQSMARVASDNVFGVDPADAQGKDDIQVLNEIHVPVNKPVLIYLSSKDVIHSFRVIAMRVTQDAIPGMRIPVHFTPTVEGRYQINCAQLCGNGHAAMTGGYLVVESQEAFDKWVRSKSPGPAVSFE
ncbi:MAG: cytochrome c oxidase subunit II [Verrucomicrobiota bacterium]